MSETKISTSYNPLGKRVPFGPHYLMPERYAVRIDDPSRPVVFEVDVVMEDGWPVCEKIAAIRRPGGPAIRGSDLRCPLDGFLRHTAADVAIRTSKGHKGGWLAAPLGDYVGMDEFYRAYQDRERETRRRRPADDARLHQVAELYRTAIADREPPANVIGTMLNVSEAHARRLVGMARKAGFLGPAIRGRAGEVATVTQRARTKED